MGSMLSSPSKQASQASSAVQGQDAGEIAQYEQYVSAQEGQLRDAISQQTNPYFQAAKEMNPSGYAVNPKDVVSFGSSGPGTTSAKNSINGPTNPTPKQGKINPGSQPKPVVPPGKTGGVSGGNPVPVPPKPVGGPVGQVVPNRG
jgi:hypothetical protein